MNPKIRSIIYWAPRVFAILLAAFLALFSLDIFDSETGFWNIALGLFMHNLPSLLIILVLVLAWRKEWAGAIIYPLLGLIYLFANLGRMHWSAFVVITGPLILAGLLFLLAWYTTSRRKISFPS